MKTIILLLVLLCAPLTALAATLTWTDTSSNELGFQIERKEGLCSAVGVYNTLAEVTENTETYHDATTQVGHRYCYRVRAWNLQYELEPESRQYSDWSNEAGIEYPFPRPVPPTGLMVVSD